MHCSRRGALSGEHAHTRTDEVYVIVSRQGEMLLNGERHRVGEGDVVLTPLGARHGLVNTSDVLLALLTIEVTRPRTTDLFPGGARWESGGAAAG